MFRESLRTCYRLGLVVASLNIGTAGGLHQISETRFSGATRGAIDDPEARVLWVSFLPHGQRLAAMVVEHHQDRPSPVLLIIGCADQTKETQVVNVRGPSAEDDRDLGPPISWSANGSAVALPTVVKIGGGSQCVSGASRAVFYAARLLATIRFSFPVSDVDFLNDDCQPQGTWSLKGKWQLSDGSPYSHLLALSNSVPNKSRIMISFFPARSQQPGT